MRAGANNLCRMRLGCLWLSVAAVWTGCAGSLASTSGDQDAVETLVVSARQAGLARHDIAHDMSMWAPEAELIVGRSEEQGRFDLVLNRAQIEATRVQRFYGWPPKRRKVDIDDVSVSVQGDEAVLNMNVTVREENGYETTAERCWLHRTPQGWRVYRARRWPLRTSIGPEEYIFGANEWQRRDDEIHAQRKTGNRTLEVVALLEAWRFREAWEVAVKATEGQHSPAMLWVMRGIAAVAAGNVEDAPLAFREALARDPKVALPPYKAAMEAALALRARQKAAAATAAPPAAAPAGPQAEPPATPAVKVSVERVEAPAKPEK